MVFRAIVATLTLSVALTVFTWAVLGPGTVAAEDLNRERGAVLASGALPGPVASGPRVAAISAGALTFSRGLNEAGEQLLPEVEFPGAIITVWAAFDYSGYTNGTRLNALVRANRKDFRSFDLVCCPGESGRLSFAIERESGRPLGGAAWEVVVYSGETELTRGGFGVRGTRGFDDDNE